MAFAPADMAACFAQATAAGAIYKVMDGVRALAEGLAPAMPAGVVVKNFCVRNALVHMALILSATTFASRDDVDLRLAEINAAFDAAELVAADERDNVAYRALIALQAIRRHSKVPAVITFAMHREELTREGLTPAQACQRLEAAGADVVGLNCHRGPSTMLPLLKQIRAAVKCHVAGLPVPYRTTPAQPSFMALRDPCCGDRMAFPDGLDPFMATRSEIFDFGREAFAADIRYLGVCCGAGPHHIRALAESLGRHPPASRYSKDMSKHAFFGSDKRIRKIQTDYREKA